VGVGACYIRKTDLTMRNVRPANTQVEGALAAVVCLLLDTLWSQKQTPVQCQLKGMCVKCDRRNAENGKVSKHMLCR
jgi:hypothetical protein